MLSKEDIEHVVGLAERAYGAATDAPDDRYVQEVLGSVYGDAYQILKDYQSWKNKDDLGSTRDEPSALARAMAELLDKMLLLKIGAELSQETATVLNQLTHADPCVGPGNLLKPAYRSGDAIRTYFYGGFNQTAKTYVRGLVTGVVGLYYTCPGVSGHPPYNIAPHQVLKTDYAIDHVKPVARHWNQKGFNLSRAARNAWLNKTSNLVPACRNCNTIKGSWYQGIKYNYNTVVGSNFTGMF